MPLTLLAVAFLQVVMAWTVYSPFIIDPKGASTEVVDIEKKFADVSVVLRYLLDRVKGNTNFSVTDALNPELSEQGGALVVTVRASSAYLRTGPSKEDSPLMTVARGTKLAVETKRGDWFRVIAPNGERTWISKDVIGPA